MKITPLIIFLILLSCQTTFADQRYRPDGSCGYSVYNDDGSTASIRPDGSRGYTVRGTGGGRSQGYQPQLAQLSQQGIGISRNSNPTQNFFSAYNSANQINTRAFTAACSGAVGQIGNATGGALGRIFGIFNHGSHEQGKPSALISETNVVKDSEAPINIDQAFYNLSHSPNKSEAKS